RGLACVAWKPARDEPQHERVTHVGVRHQTHREPEEPSLHKPDEPCLRKPDEPVHARTPDPARPWCSRTTAIIRSTSAVVTPGWDGRVTMRLATDAAPGQACWLGARYRAIPGMSPTAVG